MEEVAEKKTTARALGVKAAKSTLIYTVGNIVGSLAVLLLLVILARMLSPTDFGIYAIAIAFYNILSSHFVFGTVIRKDVPQVQDKKDKIAKLVSNGYALSLIVALIVSIIAALCSNFIAVAIYHNPAISNSLRLASLLVFLYALFNLTLATLVAIDKVKEGTIMYLAYSFIQLFAATALVYLGYGVFGAIVGLGIGLIIPSLIGIVILFNYLEWKLARPAKEIISHMLDFSIPVLASNIATYVPPNLAILLLGVYSTSAIVGNYNAGFRFGNFVTVILVSISFVLLPAFSKAFSDKELSSKIGKIYNSSIYYTLLLLLPILIYVVSVSQPLLYLLFSSKYALAPFYFAVIALGSAIAIISTYAGNLIVGYGDTKKFMYYQITAVVIQVAILFALTPTFGVSGVLIGLFVLSQIIVDLLFVYALSKQFAFKQQFGQVFRLVMLSILLFILLYFTTVLLHSSKWSLISNLAIVIVLFPPLAALTGGIKSDNIEFVRDIAKSLRVEKVFNYLIRYTELFIRKPNAKSSDE